MFASLEGFHGLVIMERGRESDVDCVDCCVDEKCLIGWVGSWDAMHSSISLSSLGVSSSNCSNDDLWVRFGRNDYSVRPETRSSAV